MDVLGIALKDFFLNPPAATLWVSNSYHEPEEMPIDIYFRGEEEMPDLELIALSLCKGKVLDVGAGVGSHALVLQGRGFDVTGMDISPAAVEIMKLRGLNQAITGDILTYTGAKYDTLLFMMNGIGLTGSISGLKLFLRNVKKLLNPGAQLVFDSSDVAYLYEVIGLPEKDYYGEITFQYQYKGSKGDPFEWIYVDQQTLKDIAKQGGWITEILYDDGEDQYLACLTLSE